MVGTAPPDGGVVDVVGPSTHVSPWVRASWWCRDIRDLWKRGPSIHCSWPLLGEPEVGPKVGPKVGPEVGPEAGSGGCWCVSLVFALAFWIFRWV